MTANRCQVPFGGNKNTLKIDIGYSRLNGDPRKLCPCLNTQNPDLEQSPPECLVGVWAS